MKTKNRKAFTSNSQLLMHDMHENRKRGRVVKRDVIMIEELESGVGVVLLRVLNKVGVIF